MGAATSAVVWAILVITGGALGFIGFWFSLRSLRLFTLGAGAILTAAVTLFGLAQHDPASANLVGAFLSGVDAVIGALLRPVYSLWWPKETAPPPGVAGRWVIAVVILLGYRQLEAWSLRWQAPQLDLSALDPGLSLADGGTSAAKAGDNTAAPPPGVRADSLDPAEFGAELRFRLTTMEVRAPAILPGGAKANALASIAETSGVSGAGMIGAAFRVAAMFWPQPRRLRVRTWAERMPDPPCHRVTVMLEDAKTGLPVVTSTVTGGKKEEAASMVAGYIARQIFAIDRTVPETCYGVADGRDLGAMQLARLERIHIECPRGMADSRERQIRILCQSAGLVRTAGIIRYELAQLLALRRQHLQALWLHAVNRELHPRFYRGRYRLAMSLTMIANPEHYLPDTDETVWLLTETMRILARCGLTDNTLDVRAELTKVPVVEPCGKSPGEVWPCVQLGPALAGKLLDAAQEDLRGVRKQLRRSQVILSALVRRDERAVWLPHWRPRHRKAFADGVCVAELLVAVRRCLLASDKRLPPDTPHPAPLRDKRDRRQLRRAIAITNFSGDAALIDRVLTPPGDGRFPPRDTRSWSPPRRPRTPSWQAAYNTACLYAALADAALPSGATARDELAKMALAKRRAAQAARAAETTPPPERAGELAALEKIQDRVIKSLRSTVDDRASELERPSDWIDSDPDFHAMCQNPLIFAEFNQFLAEQMRQDYPVAFYRGRCPLPHTPPSRDLDDPEFWPGWTEAQIISPVHGQPAAETGDGTDRLAPAAARMKANSHLSA
jgi:hypothetical protein